MTDTDNSDAGQIPLFKPAQLPARKKMSANGVKAQRTLRKYAVIAGGIGFVATPRLAGQVAIGGILVKLLDDMCRIYGITFSDQQNKILVSAVLGGAHYGWISRYLMKFIKTYTPVSHSPAGLLLRPAVSGLLVYYIGRLFLVHLESGVWHAAARRDK